MKKNEADKYFCSRRGMLINVRAIDHMWKDDESQTLRISMVSGAYLVLDLNEGRRLLGQLGFPENYFL